MGVVFLANTNDYMVTNNLMNKVTSKVVMTLMGYATDELDPKDYVDAHLFYDLVFAAFILVALMEIIKSHKWRTDNSGNLIANIFCICFAGGHSYCAYCRRHTILGNKGLCS